MPGDEAAVRTDPTTLAEITVRAVVLPHGTTCEAIDAIFVEPPEVNSLVVASGTGVALVGRRTFFQAMSGPLGYGRALHHRRPVAEVVRTAALVFPSDTSVEAAAFAAGAEVSSCSTAVAGS